MLDITSSRVDTAASQPLVARKRGLRDIVARRSDGHRLRYLGHIVGRGTQLFRVACENDLEGIVAKLRAGTYTSDPDRTTWVKVKNRDYTQARDRWELFEPRGRAVARSSARG